MHFLTSKTTADKVVLQFIHKIGRAECNEEKRILENAFQELGAQNWNLHGRGSINPTDRPPNEKLGHAMKFQNAEDASRMVLRRNLPKSKPFQAPRCPFTQHSPLENDFTTPGTQGSLQCPYAANRGGGLPTPPGNPYTTSHDRSDPIKAELHHDARSSSATSAANTNTNKCPIRFLDQHSPEEVAQYFENHKHEIPRSHEICVKRYQKNSDSIKQLDAKYGNLVSMIQGLGVKHKQFLPEDEHHDVQDGPNGDSQHGSRSVEKWAEDVSGRSSVHSSTMHRSLSKGGRADGLTQEEEEEADVRSPHFERPLREIRVGESPSRPWGISVPLTAERNEGVEMRHEKASSIPAPVQLDLQNDGRARLKPPSSQMRRTLSDQEQETPKLDRPQSGDLEERTRTPKSTSQMMVFNGPVFFGYSSSEVTQLLKSGSL